MMKRIEEIKAELANNMEEMSVDFANEYEGGSSYICDAISEYADSNVSIYYSDIERFMSEHISQVNDAISEFGWDGCGSDFHKAGQMAEFLMNKRTMYDDLEDIVKYMAALYLENQGFTEIAVDAWEEIENELANVDSGDRIDDIKDVIDGVFDYLNDGAETAGQEKNSFVA